jgi:hypothetical protein
LQKFREKEKINLLKNKQLLNETLQKQIDDKNKKNEIQKKKEDKIKIQPWIHDLTQTYKCCTLCRNNFHRGILKSLAKKE